MIIKTKKTVLIPTLFASLLLGSALVYAAPEQGNASNSNGSSAASTQELGTVTRYGKKEPAYASMADKVVQDFKFDDLKIQFRYKDGRLFNILLKNMGKQPLAITVLKKNYILGPNDSVIISPKAVRYLVIHQSSADATDTTVGKALPSRFSKHHIFELPEIDKQQSSDNQQQSATPSKAKNPPAPPSPPNS